eukprot:792064-Rhodomonas_salina.2
MGQPGSPGGKGDSADIEKCCKGHLGRTLLKGARVQILCRWYAGGMQTLAGKNGLENASQKLTTCKTDKTSAFTKVHLLDIDLCRKFRNRDFYGMLFAQRMTVCKDDAGNLCCAPLIRGDGGGVCSAHNQI